jgi:IS5 family transposase
VYACIYNRVVVDVETFGRQYDEEGALMMEVLLRQQSVVVADEGYTDAMARVTLEILMGEDEWRRRRRRRKPRRTMRFRRRRRIHSGMSFWSLSTIPAVGSPLRLTT